MGLSKYIFLFALFFPAILLAQPKEYKFRKLDITDDLSNNHIRSVFADSKGFIWIGTLSGLDRYDGYSYKKFNRMSDDPEALPLNVVYSINEDHNGILWLFTRENTLIFFDPRTETFNGDHELFHKNLKLTTANIAGIALDNDSNLWIANTQTGIYKYDRKTDQLQHLIHSEADPLSLSSDQIHSLISDSKGYIWSLNHKGLLEKIDKRQLNVVKRVQLNISYPVGSNYTYKIFIDSDDDIWVYSGNNTDGIYFYSDKRGEQRQFNTHSPAHPLNNDLVTGIAEEKRGVIWIGTDHGGINIIDKKSFTVKEIVNNPIDNNSLLSNSITSLWKDRNGIIWIGTFKSGVNYYHPELFQFGLTRNYPLNTKGLPFNDINCFAEDPSGNLWLGTNGDGLIYYDRRTDSYKSYKNDPNNPNSLSNNIIVCLTTDHNDNLWVGTYYGGLNKFDGRNFTRFVHNPDDENSLSDNRVWQVLEDSQNRIWIGTLGGGMMLFDPSTNRFTRYRAEDPNSIHSNFVQAIAEDNRGNLWIGTSNGLEIMDGNKNLIRYYANPSLQRTVLSNNNIISITRDHRNWMWVGTRDGLNCYDAATDSFRIITTADGLPDNNIISILEDGKGNLWMSTLNGLSNIQIEQNTGPFDMKFSFRNFTKVDGLQGKEFNEYSAFKTSDGEFLFGGPNGFNHFYPERIIENSIRSKVVFTGLQIHNKEVKIGEKLKGRVILKESISFARQISLKHSQNAISIQFAALNQLHPEKARFQYMLEGFNKEWIEADASARQATYTNLSPGTYTFKVKASSGDNGWEDAQISDLKIIISPPFYATWLAYLLYLGLIALGIYISHETITQREKQKYLREQEKLEHLRMHEIDSIKIKFFTNISHEFRTPLTLILTPIERLIHKAKEKEDKDQLIMIQRNGRRLLNLINQLLDFRKLEVQEFKLHPDYGNIVAFLKETAESFSDLSDYKNISFSFKASVNQIFTNFDHDKIEKILFNLLSNAFKFTPTNGKIAVFVDHLQQGKSGYNSTFNGNDYVEIRVTDTGIGIPRDKQEKIFERFFQSEASGTVVNQGSGIGLALTQEYIKVHGGTIQVESEPEKGSTFIVRIPVMTNQESSAPETDHASVSQISFNQEPASTETEATYQPVNANKPTILIVEDNEDLRFYLKENLKKNFVILEAENGQTGLEIVKENQPTLVVSDIMMPLMDGLELCAKIKSDSKTSHIPVILLSARSTSAQRLEGLQSGADDYIAKPFNYEILELKIKKLIGQRIEFQKSFNKRFEIKPGEIAITSLDEKFIQKAIETVEKHIADTEFSVERMSKELGLSRGHLYNKIMALTGKTPVEFIRIMRLKRAAQLLQKSQMTVSEIAFQVGFNDPKYFSKYFKTEFNMLPSKYADQFKKS